MFDYLKLWLYILFFIASLIAMLALSRFLRPSNPNPVKQSTYECGQTPYGAAHDFMFKGIGRYFIYALIFFTIDSVLWILISYAVASKTFLGFLGFVGYLLIVFTGLSYFIKSLEGENS